MAKESEKRRQKSEGVKIRDSNENELNARTEYVRKLDIKRLTLSYNVGLQSTHVLMNIPFRTLLSYQHVCP